METLVFNFSEHIYFPLYSLLTVLDKLVCWYAQQHHYPTTTHSLHHGCTGKSTEPAQCQWLQNIHNTHHQPHLSLEALPADMANLSHTQGVRVTKTATMVTSLRLYVLFSVISAKIWLYYTHHMGEEHLVLIETLHAAYAEFWMLDTRHQTPEIPRLRCPHYLTLNFNSYAKTSLMLSYHNSIIANIGLSVDSLCWVLHL